MTPFKRPVLPATYREASGLWRIQPIQMDGVEVPNELRGKPAPLITTPIPTFLDQLYSYTTARDLLAEMFDLELENYLGGSLELTRGQVIESMRSVPLEPAIRLSVQIQRRLRLHPMHEAKQLETLGMFYGPVFQAAGEILLRRFPRRSLFSEQQGFVLQRLLLLHAQDRPAEDLTANERARLLLAFLWIPDTMLDSDLETDAGLSELELADERLLRFFIANGGLATHTSFANELARARMLYHVIANSKAARRHRHYCPLDDWLIEAFGLSFMELQTFGFSLFAHSNIGDTEEGQLLFTNEDYFSKTRFVGRYSQALDAIAATREWYQAEFANSKENSRRAIYEVHPFLRRPVFVQRDGNAVVLGLRAVEGWLGATGAYYRFFDLARAHGAGEMENFRQFNGWLQERYTRHLAHVSHPYPRRRLAGSGRVFGELGYEIKGKGSLMTCDIAIDLGLDLVLVEVTTKRVTQKSLVDGDAESIVKDVRAMVVQKMGQLGRVVDDLAEGRARLPDVSMHCVERVWPIIVVPDGLLHTPTLWAWLENEACGSLTTRPGRPPVIEPLVLLDSEEFEALMGLVASERSLIDLLRAKTSDLWRERDFKSFMLYGRLDQEARKFPFIQQELRRNFRAMRRSLKGEPLVEPDGSINLAA